MSDQNDDYSYEDEQSSEGSPKGLREALKRAQAEAKANADAATELAKFKRESVFRDVGLDPKKPNHQDFMKAYEGDLSEQAIREAAETRGYLEPPAPEVPSEETDAINRISTASQGAPPAYQGDPQQILNQLDQVKTAAEFDAILGAHGMLNEPFVQ